MARIYRFFARHMVKETLPQSAERPFHLTEALEPEIVYQLTKVLRVKAGDRVVLLPAMLHERPATLRQSFFEYVYAVETAGKKDIVLRFAEKKANENELPFELGLILCLPNKPDKLEFIVQKAVELGVCRIVLAEGDFSQMKHHLRPERLEKIVIEAAEQSERAGIPEMTMSGKLRDYLTKLSSGERKKIFVAMEREDGKNFADLLQSGSAHTDVTILIGPEGGFSDEEKKLITELKLPRFSLGRRILRMETAAILSLGLASLLKPPLPQ